MVRKTRYLVGLSTALLAAALAFAMSGCGSSGADKLESEPVFTAAAPVAASPVPTPLFTGPAQELPGNRQVSIATGGVGFTSPANGANISGNFTATVNTTLNNGVNPYVIYTIQDGAGNIIYNYQSWGYWNPPNFSQTLFRPPGVVGDYWLVVDYWAMDNPAPYIWRHLGLAYRYVKFI